jgi:hypothetical protein
MLHALEDRVGILHDFVRPLALDMRNETYATTIVLESRVVQPDLFRKTNLITNAHLFHHFTTSGKSWPKPAVTK